MLQFNPLNEKLKKQYEEALLHGAHKEKRTADAVWKAINLFEEFTQKQDFTTFNAEQAKGFKKWLAKQKNVQGELLSLSTTRTTLANVREFFKWLDIHPKYIRKIDGRVAAYLQLSKNEERAGRSVKPKPTPTIEQIDTALQAMPHSIETEKRDRAIIAFTALTGVRDAAIISLKLGDVNLETLTIWQDPRHVKTKQRKPINSHFLAFSNLWQSIVLDWVSYCTDTLKFKPDAPLFPKTEIVNNPEKLTFEVKGLSHEHWANATPVREIFKTAFTQAGLPYFHPHSFRRMIVATAYERCDQKQTKAISQSLGHEHLMTTYNAYGTLNDHEQAKAIASIGKGKPELQNLTEDELLAELMARREK